MEDRLERLKRADFSTGNARVYQTAQDCKAEYGVIQTLLYPVSRRFEEILQYRQWISTAMDVGLGPTLLGRDAVVF